VLTALVSAVGTSGAADASTTSVRSACADARPGFARCFAQYVPANTDGTATPAANSAVRPSDIRNAYRLPADAGVGRTVGIVDAFDNPKAASDLNKFRARYHLPPCTTANGCFRKVNQAGDATPLPPRDPGWGLEIALDLDAVSSACPNCSILLVEGKDNSLLNLARSVNTAVRLGADVVSNSYGADEFGGMHQFTKPYLHPGVPITASTGDFGFGVAAFPAVLRTTIAVGGTRLMPAPGTPRGWSEKAWSGAGSGCSAYVPKPVWQHDPNCLMRTVGDISADADPATGLIVEDSFGFPGRVQVGGTSLASPLVAAMIAQSADPTSVNNAQGIYADPADLNDAVGGRNGWCGGDYLCTGLPGYDAPTGMGTPNGLGALS
jgi:subtilase family serine protease